MNLSHCNAPMLYNLGQDAFVCPVCGYRATSAEAATEKAQEPPPVAPSA